MMMQGEVYNVRGMTTSTGDPATSLTSGLERWRSRQWYPSARPGRTWSGARIHPQSARQDDAPYSPRIVRRARPHTATSSPRLVDQDDDQANDDQDQEQDTFPPSRVRLVPLCNLELPFRRHEFARGLLYIVFD
jgi:hypothetical protein